MAGTGARWRLPGLIVEDPYVRFVRPPRCRPSRQTAYLLTLLRRLVNYQVSIAALLEVALVCAIPYLAVGAIVAGAR
ncbi:hypothetical protein I552_5132 [Mycobacterium xenopi 3993]|nr:hypothetical protein I552_5132 [Mycobacterium xenopi 3993]